MGHWARLWAIWTLTYVGVPQNEPPWTALDDVGDEAPLGATSTGAAGSEVSVGARMLAPPPSKEVASKSDVPTALETVLPAAVPSFDEQTTSPAQNGPETPDAPGSKERLAALSMAQWLTDMRPIDPEVKERFWASELSATHEAWASALIQSEGLDVALPEVADTIWFLRGQWLMRLSRPQEAELAFVRCIAHAHKDPVRFAAHLNRARALIAMQKPLQAEVALTHATNLSPKNEGLNDVRLALAELYLMGNDVPRASSVLRKLAASAPPQMAKRAVDRLEGLVAAKQLSGDAFGERLAYIDQLLSARALKEAEAPLGQLEACAQAPIQKRLLTARRAALLARRHDYQAALVRWRSLLRGPNQPQDRQIWRELGNTLASMGRTSEAVLAYANAISMWPKGKDKRDLAYRVAFVAYDGGLYKKAHALFADYVRRYGKALLADEARWYMAWNAYHLGEYTLALRELNQLERAYPHSTLTPRALYWQARILLQIGHKERAEKLLLRLGQSPTGYYPMLSRLRLAQLYPKTAAAKSFMPLDFDGEEAKPPSLQQSLGALDFVSAKGRRIFVLLSLGLAQTSASEIADLNRASGTSAWQAALAKAQLTQALGDLSQATRLAQLAVSHMPRLHDDGAFLQALRKAYPKAFADSVARGVKDIGVTDLLVWSIMRQESVFDDRARSWAHAQGLMQIMPQTGINIARRLGDAGYKSKSLSEPDVNVRFGAWYLAELIKKFDGQLGLAAAAYNAGPQAAERWARAHQGAATDVFIEDISFKETRGYVKNVLSNLATYRALYKDRATSESLPLMHETVSAAIGNNISF